MGAVSIHEVRPDAFNDVCWVVGSFVPESIFVEGSSR